MNRSSGNADRRARSTVSPPTPESNTPIGRSATVDPGAGPSPRDRVTLASSEDVLGDHHALDLRGALVDLHELGVAVDLLDRVLARVAVAAEHLHGVRGALHHAVGTDALGDRAGVGATDALVDLPRGLVVEEARGLVGHRHLG